MRCIADIIEQYLKELLSESPLGMVEIQRSELASRFRCVPSQITYVINTRFTLEKGYLVESKRGGGGFIRIRKVQGNDNQSLYRAILERIGDSVSQSASDAILQHLYEAGWLEERELRLLKTVLSRNVLPLPIPLRDQVRAAMLRAVVAEVLSDGWRRNAP
ncbi:MAG TPA: CtsR family transcriptional regulator [Calditerricola sp.]